MAVGCEACHGPGATHARLRSGGEDASRDPYGRPTAAAAMDACAPCHALRRELVSGFQPGSPFLDFFEPLLLDGDAYHPDGQLHGESYEWASFLQSRMAQVGVTCLSCHDAHTGRIKAEGNTLCLGCHERRLGTPEHTHHAPTSAAAACVGCHMPVTVFMERDPRHDHLFGLPDPQMTVELGIPNACGRCHASEPPAWAAAHVAEWYGDSVKRRARRELASAFARARRGDPTTIGRLIPCARDGDPVRRASAVRLLARFVREPDVLDTLLSAAKAEDPLVRASAVWALAEPPEAGAGVSAALVAATGDPLRLVRMNAAWGLRRHPPGGLARNARRSVQRALDEWRAAMATQAEHPETHHTLGVFYADRGELDDAEQAYRTALRLAPDAVPSRYNLAMLLVRRGDRVQAEEELLQVRQLDPGFAPAAYSLGLLYGEAGHWREAVAQLTDCLKRDPLYPGALTDLAHAYAQLGEGALANTVLEAAARYPGAGREALRALVAVNLALGDRERARRWAREAAGRDDALAADPRVAELLEP
jgi:predicted CXXCH cytochrome family protein